MNNLSKMRKELDFEATNQKINAWKVKDFHTAQKIRQKEQENYEKIKLIDGIMKANRKGNKNGNKQ